MVKRFLKTAIDTSLLMAGLIFLLMRPYFFWHPPQIMPVMVSLTIIAITFTHLSVKKNTGLLCVLFFAYIYSAFMMEANIIGYVVNFFPLAFLPFMNMAFLLKVYTKFRIIIICVLAISIVSFITVLMGIQSPSEIIAPLNELKDYQYEKFFFLVQPDNIENFGRFCSVFDEPGVVGTLTGLMLCIERFSFKKKGNIIILLSGLLSLSLFFYVIAAIFLLYKSPFKYKVMFVAGVVVLYVLTVDNEILEMMLWNRLTIDEDGSFSGDDRNTKELQALWDKSKYDLQILFGYGHQLVNKYKGGSASIHVLILTNGLLFVLTYFAVYLVYAKRMMKSNMEVILFAMILLGTLYQRPFVRNIDYALLFTVYILSRVKLNNSISSYHSTYKPPLINQTMQLIDNKSGILS